MLLTVPLPKNYFSLYGGEPYILEHAALNVIDSDDLVISLGLDIGGNVKNIIDVLKIQNNKSKIIAVDPYGNLELETTLFGADVVRRLLLNDQLNMGIEWNPDWGDPTSKTEIAKIQWNFSNDLRDEIVPIIYKYAKDRGMDFRFYNMTADEFYQKYANGVTYYDNNTTIVKNTYKFVNIDRTTTQAEAIKAFNFFKNKIVKDGIIVFDDVYLYDFTPIETMLTENGYEGFDVGEYKVAYIKT